MDARAEAAAGGPSPVTRSVGKLGASTACAAVLGFAVHALIGNYFGAGPETDAYFMSLLVVGFLAKGLMFRHVRLIALPEYLAMGGSAGPGRELLARLRRHAVWVALGFAGAAVVLAPWIVDVFAPGYDEAQRRLTVRLFRIRVPELVLLAVAATSLVALQASRRFGRADLGNKVLPVATVALLLAWIGDRAGLEGLAWANMAGIVAGTTALVFCAHRLKTPKRARSQQADPRRSDQPRADPSQADLGHADLRQAELGVWRRWAAFGWSNSAVMAAEWVYRIAASTLGPGLFSAVRYGRLVQDVLGRLFNDSAATVGLVEFSHRKAAGRGSGVGDSLGVGQETLSAVAVPIAVFVVLMSEWLAALLFGRGQMVSDGMLGPVGASMALFMVGVVVHGRNQLAFSAAFAMGHSGLVNKVQAAGHIFRALLLLPAVWLWSYMGLVAAQVAMNVVVAGAFWLAAPPELAPNGRLRGGALRGLGRISAATAVPGVLLLMFLSLGDLPDPVQAGELRRLAFVGVAGLSWCVVVLAAGWLVRVPLYRQLAQRAAR